MTSDPPEGPPLHRLRRQLRLIAILHAADRAGLAPMQLNRIHIVAYFADALAPVWGLRIMDAQLLKYPEGPMSPRLQKDLDSLVGMGIARVGDVRHRRTDDGRWRLGAVYRLNKALAQRIITVATEMDLHAAHFAFVEELVFAISGLSDQLIDTAPLRDAAYSDSLVDTGGLLDLAAEFLGPNQAVRFARQFAGLFDPTDTLSAAEMTQLYIRHLRRRTERVA